MWRWRSPCCILRGISYFMKKIKIKKYTKDAIWWRSSFLFDLLRPPLVITEVYSNRPLEPIFSYSNYYPDPYPDPAEDYSIPVRKNSK